MQQARDKSLRQHADEARALADRMRHFPTKLTMWNLACRYDLLARHAEAYRLGEGGNSSASGDRKPDGRAG